MSNTQVRNVSGVKRCFKNVEGNTEVRSASVSVKRCWMQRAKLQSEILVLFLREKERLMQREIFES